jgi:hypothetical protein
MSRRASSSTSKTLRRSRVDPDDLAVLDKWQMLTPFGNGVADFDAALRDPEIPTQMRAVDDCGDGRHPSDSGYCKMGDAIAIIGPNFSAQLRTVSYEIEPAIGEKLLDIAVAQGEPEVQPDGVLDDDRGKAAGSLARPARYPDNLPSPNAIT